MVLSLCKAGVDALRVARGEGHVAGAPIDPLTEMILCKFFEMVFESIPGGLLQAIFILYNGVTTAALLSILLSCLSTAFTTTMIAYDLDTNAAKRKNNPEFYGYARPASAWPATVSGTRVAQISVLSRLVFGRYVPGD